jgi:hypothetical protein
VNQGESMLKMARWFLVIASMSISCGALASEMKGEKIDIYSAFKEAESNQLRGLKAIGVSVHLDSNEKTEIGISEESIENSIELKLRQSGISIPGETGGFRSLLFCDINLIKHPIGVYFYYLTLSLRERIVTMKTQSRPKVTEIIVGGETWKRSSTGYGPPAAIAAGLRESLEKHVEEFLNLYLKANPIK